jgi:phosphoribosylformimino-5-aminoimidazole carboxamide ribonucleotide (ProFAR) isomerase
MAEKFSGKIALGLDARDDKVAADSWTKKYFLTFIEDRNQSDEIAFL